MKERFLAFTLAEVLITLGIIGVVAAMTIPNVLNYFQQQAYLSGFKKMYTVLSQAYLSAAQENGTADKWESSKNAYDYMKPFLNVSMDCVEKKGCFPEVLYRGISDITDYAYPNYNNISSAFKVRLSDGTSVAFTTGFSIVFDVNGDRPPNRWGYDVFSVLIDMSAPKLVGSSGSTVSWSVNNCSRKNPSETSIPGGTCSSWILRHWNMDYLNRVVTESEW